VSTLGEALRAHPGPSSSKTPALSSVTAADRLLPMFCFEEEPDRRSAAGLLTKDAARGIAANLALKVATSGTVADLQHS
jgi:hypothetical protein